MSLPHIQDILHAYLIEQRDARDEAEDLLPGVLHSRASSAGACARQIGLQMTALPMSDAPTPDSLWNFGIGDYCHDTVKAAVIRACPDAKPEAEVIFDDYLTGHTDLLLTDDEVIEIKSVSEFGWEGAVLGVLRYEECQYDGCGTGAGFLVLTNPPDVLNRGMQLCAQHRDLALKSGGQKIGDLKRKRGEPEGPKAEHRLQAAIYAHGHGCSKFRVVYVRKTAVKGEKICEEWTFATADYELLVKQELQRHQNIVSTVRGGFLPPRLYDGVVIDPQAGKFPCSYCVFNRLCVSLGPGVVKVPQLSEGEMAFMVS